VAIGAQNAFIIRQGLKRQHVLVVVAICALADASLIALGIAGLGAIIQGVPWLLEGVRWFGVAYLIWFGIKSVRSAFSGNYLESGATQSAPRKKVITTVLAMTFLNPHVYLDTVIFLGSISNQFEGDRWFFAAGASAASFLWFALIGFGAKSAARYMAKPIFWKILDLAIAAVMFAIAWILAFFNF
jgi:L-lysine exporter family protein LysE/ArgO